MALPGILGRLIGRQRPLPEPKVAAKPAKPTKKKPVKGS